MFLGLFKSVGFQALIFSTCTTMVSKREIDHQVLTQHSFLFSLSRLPLRGFSQLMAVDHDVKKG